MKEELDTYAQNTWCPGCGNFGILKSLKDAIFEMQENGINKRDFVLTTGVGCGSKISDYIDINTFCSLHGRPIATAQGIKIGNPNLKVIASIGDGGGYDEGIAHLIHAAKRNIDITVIIHNNRNFALTTSQYTAVSPKGFKGKSTPRGSVEMPINPLSLMLSSNATFIARSYSAKNEHLKNLIFDAISHKGFSIIEILQPCITFFNTFPKYNEVVYELKGNNTADKKEAQEKIEEWDYNKDKKIPIGLFYKVEKPSYEELI